MDIYNKVITAEYPLEDMQLSPFKMGGFQIHNYSYGKVDTAIVIGIWNGEAAKKQTIHFTEEAFVEMMMEKEEGEYLWTSTAEALEMNGGSIKDAYDDGEIYPEDIESAVKFSGRISFRISWDELQKAQRENPDWTRKECINWLVDKKTTIPMPTEKDMPLEEAA